MRRPASSLIEFSSLRDSLIFDSLLEKIGKEPDISNLISVLKKNLNQKSTRKIFFLLILWFSTENWILRKISWEFFVLIDCYLQLVAFFQWSTPIQSQIRGLRNPTHCTVNNPYLYISDTHFIQNSFKFPPPLHKFHKPNSLKAFFTISIFLIQVYRSILPNFFFAIFP